MCKDRQSPSKLEAGVDWWVQLQKDFHPGDQFLCPLWNQNSDLLDSLLSKTYLTY